MGIICNPIKLEETIDFFSIENFVETGTGLGTSIEYILNTKHQNINIYSIEILEDLYLKAKEKFVDKQNVCLLQGKSDIELKTIIDKLGPNPTMFWLDAHFPGADFHINGATYGSESDENIRIPLEQELNTIVSSGRDIIYDVIVIDDLRIYEDGPFANGNWNERKLFGGDGIDFIVDNFAKTHYITRSYVDEGYLILFPQTLDRQMYYFLYK